MMQIKELAESKFWKEEMYSFIKKEDINHFKREIKF